jgi:hypothetical protein
MSQLTTCHARTRPQRGSTREKHSGDQTSNSLPRVLSALPPTVRAYRNTQRWNPIRSHLGVSSFGVLTCDHGTSPRGLGELKTPYRQSSRTKASVSRF